MASFVPSLLIFSLFLVCHAFSPITASSLTAPAFVWSDYRSFGLQTQGAVDYRVFSPLTLVDTLMQKFGWSSLLCASHGGVEEKVDTVVAFIGSQLRSEDLSHDANNNDLAVVTTLKELFLSSNYSMALPYVSIPVEGPGIANMLVSTIKNSCDLKSRPGKTLVVGPCLKEIFDPKWPIWTEGLELVENVEDAKEFIYYRKASRTNGETDIIVACPPTFNVGPKVAESEGDMLATIVSALRQSGTRNAVLYASDPIAASSPYKYHGRLLAFNASSSNSTCDEVCETIAGVYEGVIVAITLLIILISGLCCMMGIDTPSRFETSQDS